jgi:hypothetical protein
MEQPIFSSIADANGNAYTYSELDQLSNNSSVIDVKTDPVSKLDHVVLGDGPFSFSQQSYINDTIDDVIIGTTQKLNNVNFPVTVSDTNRFDFNIDIKNDYFLYPAAISITGKFQLYVEKSDGKYRSIVDSDLLCPLDSLCPIKNIYPRFDNMDVIPANKVCDQRLFSRVMSLITDTTDVQAAECRKRFSRMFFEGETVANNKSGKIGSHKWVETRGQKTPAIYSKTESGGSKQNRFLALAAKDEFYCHFNLSQVPPFNAAVVYSRPCSNIAFALDFGKFSEWLRIVTPDGDGPATPYVQPKDSLAHNFSNLRLRLKEVIYYIPQFRLNNLLLKRYKDLTVHGKASVLNQQSIQILNIANPIPKGSTTWSYHMQGKIVPDKIFFIFVSKENRTAAKGNPFFFSNLGITEIIFRVNNSSENRFNQIRKSAFQPVDTEVCRSTAEYNALSSDNKRYQADLFINDLILRHARLAAGYVETGRNCKTFYLLNEETTYQGNYTNKPRVCRAKKT